MKRIDIIIYIPIYNIYKSKDCIVQSQNCISNENKKFIKKKANYFFHNILFFIEYLFQKILPFF